MLQLLICVIFFSVFARGDLLTNFFKLRQNYCGDECADLSDPPRLRNIGYLGTSYDIFKGNSLSVDQVLDPGFIFGGVPLFKFSYEQNKTTTDGAYSIPDGTTMNSIESCSFSFSSSVTKSTKSYSDSLKVSVDAQFKYFGASFSASSDYTKVSSETSSGESVYISSHAQCETYGGSIDDAPFSDAFVHSVENLENTTEAYKTFIHDWGTHVASSLVMGGRYGIRSKFETSKYNSLSSTSFNIKAAGGYSGLVSVSASLATDIEKKQAKTFEDNRKEYDLFTVGGKPPVDENGTVFEWAEKLKESPLPVRYQLTDLYKYLNAQNFPNDTNINDKRIGMKNALLDYCLDTVPNTALCYAEYGPKDDGRVRASFTNDVINSPAKINASSYPDGSKWYTFVQYGSNPYMQAVGNVENFPRQAPSPPFNQTNTSAIFMLDIKSITSNFSVPPTGMIQGGYGISRMQCPNGYVTLTDLQCPQVNKTKSYPFSTFNSAIVPCISRDCVTQCSRGENCDKTSKCYMIGSGYPELGNSGKYGFWRDLTLSDSTPLDDLFLCLNYTCLSVVSI